MKQGKENQAVRAGGIPYTCTVCEDGYKATTNGICTNPACPFSATTGGK